MFKLEDFDDPERLRELCKEKLCYVTKSDLKHNIHVYQTSNRPDLPEQRGWLMACMGAEQFLNDFFKPPRA